MTKFVSATADIRGAYRYSLTRVWDETQPTLTFVLLNPSTADEQELDPTLTRCLHGAKRNGFGSMLVLNLYAFRSTYPRVMKAAKDPIGPENDLALSRATGTVVAGWGNHATRERVAHALTLLPALHVLGLNKGGQPTHPLYVRGDAPFIEWKP